MAVQPIYSTYTKAKQVLQKINALTPPIDASRTNEVNEVRDTIEKFLTENLIFAQFCTNIYGQPFNEESLNIFNNPTQISQASLDQFRAPISAFIYNILGGPNQTISSLPPQEILNQVANKVTQSPNIEETAKTLIPSLEDQIKNAQTLWQTKILQETLQPDTPQAVKNLLYQEVSQEGLRLVEEHVAAGGDLKDPLLGKTIAQQITNQSTLATAWVNKKNLAKTIEETWQKDQVGPDQILAAHLAETLKSQVELPTAEEVAQNIKNAAIETLDPAINDAQAIDLLHEIEKTIATTAKGASTPEAIAQAVSGKFKDISPENLIAFTEKISPTFKTYRKGLEALIPKEKISKVLADQTSIACQSIRNKMASLDIKEVFSWFTILRHADFTTNLPSFNVFIE